MAHRVLRARRNERGDEMRNFILATMLVVGGCEGGNPVDDEPDQIDDATKADSSAPLGDFTGSVRVGQITDLVLSSDKSYDYFIQMVDCIPGPCRAQKGDYKFSHSSTTKYIRFLDDSGNLVERYAYTLSGTTLKLRRDHDTVWFTLKKNDLGAVGDSCGGFTRTPGKCAAALQCVFTHVPDVPGTCQDPDRNPCVSAGGECVALSPGSCNGEVQDATKFSCGGGLGIECCFKH
jgi:hypothetical protein